MRNIMLLALILLPICGYFSLRREFASAASPTPKTNAARQSRGRPLEQRGLGRDSGLPHAIAANAPSAAAER